jgi:hypothetical protein
VKNFYEINDLPILDLTSEYDNLIKEGRIWYSEREPNQICLNSTINKLNDMHYGAGSLVFDWDLVGTLDDSGNVITSPTLRETPLEESDFTELCSQFKGTLFEDAYVALQKKYNLGRVRIMRSKPKTCLSWHYDYDVRVHYPLKTYEGCLMVIEDEVCHLTANKWWYTETQKMHTAFNASAQERIHLVATVISSK